MKAEEIKKELEMMYNFMEAEETLCGRADMSFDYAGFLERSYKLIAQRLGISVEEVRKADECLIF